jgi:hypothetical protein
MDEPFGGRLLCGNEPGADRPLKRPRGDTHHADDDKGGLPRIGRDTRNVDDLVVG